MECLKLLISKGCKNIQQKEQTEKIERKEKCDYQVQYDNDYVALVNFVGYIQCVSYCYCAK